MSDLIHHAQMGATFTAADDTGTSGRLSALVSAYDVKYRIGMFTHHTIRAGAFTESIAAQPSIPLFYAHDWTDGGFPIGHATASESDEGLQIDGQLYLDANPNIRQLWESMKAGAIREYSIGYDVQTQTVDADDEDHFFIDTAGLLEASAVLRGANPQTRTLELAERALGRPPTKIERELITAGKPFPVQGPAAPQVVAATDRRGLLLSLYGTAS